MNHVLEMVREEADGLWHAVCRACGYGTLGATAAEAARNAEDAECVPAHVTLDSMSQEERDQLHFDPVPPGLMTESGHEEHQPAAEGTDAADPGEAHPGEEAEVSRPED